MIIGYLDPWGKGSSKGISRGSFFRAPLRDLSGFKSRYLEPLQKQLKKNSRSWRASVLGSRA